jgi:hypothetical protein
MLRAKSSQISFYSDWILTERWTPIYRSPYRRARYILKISTRNWLQNSPRTSIILGYG